MKVIIASTNPVKVNATKEAFASMLPEIVFEYVGISAPSDVADQPMSDQETFIGASNRVNNARKQEPDADYWVGIEGGLEMKKGELEVFAWVVIQDKEEMIGKGRSTTFFLPPIMAQKIAEGMELGHAADVVFNEKNSKQNQGTIGILTGNVIDRTRYYVDPTIAALIPFKSPSLYIK
jgi:inosine/xanthosine triphosphatase